MEAYKDPQPTKDLSHQSEICSLMMIALEITIFPAA